MGHKYGAGVNYHCNNFSNPWLATTHFVMGTEYLKIPCGNWHLNTAWGKENTSE